MTSQPAKQEVLGRIGKLYDTIIKQDDSWDFVFITDKINQYYFTGTIQDGLFVLKNDGSYSYFVRRSFQRAKDECLIQENLYPMVSYKDVAVITSKLDVDFLSGFMGIGNERVNFLGHGVGLQVDEYPVIANRFDEPLVENMTIAVEPKRSIAGFGIVGVEDTYVVTKDGGRCITGGEKEIMVV